MAKIQNLTVEAINIANNAVSGIVSGTSSITVPSVSNVPVLIVGIFQGFWNPGSGSPPPSFNLSVTVVRSRGSKTVIARSIGLGSGDGGNFAFSDTALDPDVQTGDVYNLSVTANPVGGTGGGSGSISALYYKV